MCEIVISEKNAEQPTDQDWGMFVDNLNAKELTYNWSQLLKPAVQETKQNKIIIICKHIQEQYYHNNFTDSHWTLAISYYCWKMGIWQALNL